MEKYRISKSDCLISLIFSHAIYNHFFLSFNFQNELAKETVFTINGRVLVETDLTVSETSSKNPIAVRTDLSDSGTIKEITVSRYNDGSCGISIVRLRAYATKKKNSIF